MYLYDVNIILPSNKCIRPCSKGKMGQRIHIYRGILQGDSLSSLLFSMLTACIIDHIKTNPDVITAARRRLKIIAYADDIKCITRNRETVDVITTELLRALKELELELNLRKCATFSSDADDNNECEIPSLEDCYRYLGLYQTERDTIHNITDVSRRAIEKAEEILQSGLTTRQKQELYNSTVVSTAVYVTGNLYPEEGVRSTLVRCREIDMAIRKLAVMHQIKTTTTSNQRFYLPRSVGGLAFRNIEVETAIQYVRRYWYLQTHPEMEETKTIYERLHEKGRRTPIGDYQHIRKKYKIGNHHGPDTPTQDICRLEIEDIRTTDYDERCRDWAKSMNYPKLVLKYRDRISFPATGSAFLGSRKLSLINAAAEEQITALRPSQSYAEHLCRFGCGVNETAYHVSTSCRQHSYTSRHDNTAY